MASIDNLDKDTKQKLAAIIQELKNRGKELPQDVVDSIDSEKKDKNLKWFRNEHGYFFRNDGRGYTPYDATAAFIDSTAAFVGLKGSRGCGKSSAGAQKAMKKIMEGQSGAVMNPDFENFKISTWPELREWIPWNNVIKKHQHRKEPDWFPDRPFVMTFKNGATLLCKGLKNADSARGPNINFLWYDEAQKDPDGLAWKVAVACVRVGKNPQSFATYTPAGKLHWTYKFFTEQSIPEEVVKAFAETEGDRALIEVFKGTIEDNRGNLEPSFYAAIRAAYAGTGWLERQEIFGEDVNQEGAIGGSVADALKNQKLSICPNITMRVRFWDLAGTEKKIIHGRVVNDPDELVGTLMSFDGTENFYIEHQQCGFHEWDKVKEVIRDTRLQDGPSVRYIFEQEPASGGKNQVAELINYLKDNFVGWPLAEGWLPREVGDRVMGANYWFAEAKQQHIYIIDDGSWDVEGCINQIANFPIARHDDKVTSITGARCNLAPIKRWKTIEFIHL